MRRGYVDVEFGQLHYRESGEGPPLVLLHKTPSSSIQYSRVMPLLGERYRCIALDTPGFGMSDPFPSQPLMGDYGRAAIAFLRSRSAVESSPRRIRASARLLSAIA